MTAWTDHIKKFAKEHNMTYGCALSDPACSASYTKEPKKKSAKKTAVVGKDTMDAFPELEKDDSDTPAPKKKVGKSYPELIDEKMRKLNEFVEKIKKGNTKKEKLIKDLDKLRKVGTDKYGNIYLKESSNYFQKKYGNGWNISHSTAPKDKYWAIEDKIIDIYKKAEELIKEVEEPVKKKAPKSKGKGTCSSAEAAPPPPEPTPTLSRVYRNDKSGNFKEYNPMPTPPPKELTPINKAKAVIVKSGKPIGAAKPKGKNLPTALLPKAEPAVKPKKGKGIKEFVNRVVYGKKDYSASIKKIIDKYGNEEVKEIELHRFVLPTIYTKILSVWTKGETDRRLQEEPKDKLFHISMWVKLGSGTTILVEKNTTINMKVNPTKKDKEEVQSVPMPPNGLTFRSMLEKTQKEMGDDKYFSYSAKDNNCGNYIEAVLKTNGMSSKATYDFINQDTKKILEGYPTLRKITNTLTDIGGAAETLLQGGAVQRFSKSGYHYPITPELAKKMVLAHKALPSKKPRKISAKKQALANRAEVLTSLAIEAANNKANLVANKQLAKKTNKDTELGEFLKKWTSA